MEKEEFRRQIAKYIKEECEKRGLKVDILFGCEMCSDSDEIYGYCYFVKLCKNSHKDFDTLCDAESFFRYGIGVQVCIENHESSFAAELTYPREHYYVNGQESNVIEVKQEGNYIVQTADKKKGGVAHSLKTAKKMAKVLAKSTGQACTITHGGTVILINN